MHVEGDEVLTDLPRRNVVFLANHQTYFLEAIAFFDLVYVRHQFPLEDPVLRFSAAEETMKKNLLTKLMTLAGGVTFRRSFREGGRRRAAARWTWTASRASRRRSATAGCCTSPPAPRRRARPCAPGVSRLLHNTKAVALPVRVDGFRELLLHKQLPGKLFKRCSLKIHPPLDLDDFYAKPYRKEDGARVLAHARGRRSGTGPRAAPWLASRSSPAAGPCRRRKCDWSSGEVLLVVAGRLEERAEEDDLAAGSRSRRGRSARPPPPRSGRSPTSTCRCACACPRAR